VAAISKSAALEAPIYCEESLNCILFVEFKRTPVSATCVKVTSAPPSPKDNTAPSAKYKSENSKAVVPKAAPSDASGTKAVVAVIVVP